MFVRKLSLDRRTFLRGTGVTLALPMLDAMLPAFAATTKAIPRMSFLYTPNGVNPATWPPVGTGTEFKFSPALAALEPYRDRVTVLTNMSHHSADRQNDGAGDHSRATGVFLSGCHAKRTQGADLHLGVTADQIAARSLGKDNLLPSLEISLEDRNVAPLCDEGYTCAYSNTLSWSSPTTPLPMENDPRLVFERLFGEEANPRDRAYRLQEDRSILDSVNGSINRLNSKLGPNDKRKVDQYYSSIREVELRLQRIEAQNAKSPTATTMKRPLGVPEKFEDHIHLMFGREMATRSYPQIGVPDSHHSLSHHDNNPAKLAKLAKIDNYHVQMVAYFLGKLSAAQDGENNLLDNSIIVYGGGIGNGNLHNHERLPIFVAGGGAGTIQGGRHIEFKNDTPVSNLLRTVLDKAGVQTETLGDSTGLLTEL